MNEKSLISYEEKKKFFQTESISLETRKAIRKNWNRFEDWCNRTGKTPFPSDAQTLEAYLIYLQGENLKNSTIEQAKWAVEWLHRQNRVDLKGDVVSLKRTLSGLKRVNKKKIKKRKALSLSEIHRMSFSDNLRGLRDKALILIGFSGGLRRSEIANMNREDLEFVDRGARLTLLASKTNAFGAEEFVDIPYGQKQEYCPIVALKNWLDTSGIDSGKLFRGVRKNNQLTEQISTVSVGQIVKNHVSLIGLNPELYCGHSLRSGCVTHLLNKGVAINIVAKHLRHKKTETTLAYDQNITMDQIRELF